MSTLFAEARGIVAMIADSPALPSGSPSPLSAVSVDALSPSSHKGSQLAGPPEKTGSSLCKLLGRLRFRHLLLLAALDEHRNLHRAAKAVHLAQPSASGQLHDLESLFGSSLFDRLPTGMQPTELGCVVLAFARHTLGDLKRLAADLDHRRANRDGHLVIGTAADLLPGTVAQAMVELKRRRPLLAVKAVGDAGEEIVRRLIEGHIDVAVGYFAGKELPNDVDYHVIARESPCIVLRKNHPLCREPHLDVGGLERAAWILHPGTMFSCEIVQRFFLHAGLKSPTDVLESSSLAMTRDLLLSTDSITILPESVARHQVREGQALRLPVILGSYLIEFGILTRREEVPSPAAAEFGELLRRYSDPIDYGNGDDNQMIAAASAGA
jgi:DNA-binding transcriptional LysR family regulator